MGRSSPWSRPTVEEMIQADPSEAVRSSADPCPSPNDSSRSSSGSTTAGRSCRCSFKTSWATFAPTIGDAGARPPPTVVVLPPRIHCPILRAMSEANVEIPLRPPSSSATSAAAISSPSVSTCSTSSASAAACARAIECSTSARAVAGSPSRSRAFSPPASMTASRSSAPWWTGAVTLSPAPTRTSAFTTPTWRTPPIVRRAETPPGSRSPFPTVRLTRFMPCRSSPTSCPRPPSAT